MDRVEHVIIWHDAENTVITRQTDGYKLRRNLLNAVRKSLPNGMEDDGLLMVQWHLVLPAAAATHDLRMGPLRMLNQLGVNHIDPGDKHGACDFKIKSLIENWLTDHGRFVNSSHRDVLARTAVVLLSGDSDFNSEVQRLRRFGVHVVAVCNAQNGSRALSTYATAVIPEWQKILQDSVDSDVPDTPAATVSPLDQLLAMLEEAGNEGIVGAAIPPQYQKKNSKRFPLKVSKAIADLRSQGINIRERPRGKDKCYWLDSSARGSTSSHSKGPRSHSKGPSESHSSIKRHVANAPELGSWVPPTPPAVKHGESRPAAESKSTSSSLFIGLPQHDEAATPTSQPPRTSPLAIMQEQLILTNLSAPASSGGLLGTSRELMGSSSGLLAAAVTPPPARAPPAASMTVTRRERDEHKVSQAGPARGFSSAASAWTPPGYSEPQAAQPRHPTSAVLRKPAPAPVSPHVMQVFNWMKSLHWLLCDAPSSVPEAQLPTLFYQRYKQHLMPGLGGWSIAQVGRLFGWQSGVYPQYGLCYFADASIKQLSPTVETAIQNHIKGGPP